VAAVGDATQQKVFVDETVFFYRWLERWNAQILGD
jgi:hypothetical protein